MSTPSDYPDWQTPQQNATRIAATGVPLLRLSNQKKFATGTTIAGGGTSVLLTSGAFVQPGYEIGFEAYLNAGVGTLPFVALQLQWFDASTSIPTARRDIVITAGNGVANKVTSFFNGPCRGNTLKLTAVNLDPSQTVTLNWTINQTSHVYEHDQAGQLAYPAVAPNGYSNAIGVNGTNVILWAHPVLSAGGNQAYLCALYGGDVFLQLDCTGLQTPTVISITDAPGYATGNTAGEYYGNTLAAGGSLYVPMTLPFSPVLVNLSNTGTVNNQAPKAMLIAQNH